MISLAQIRWKLFGIRDKVIDRTAETLKAAQESRQQTREVNLMLREYADRANPLVSMMGDLYNQRQIEQTWRGPP